MKSETYQTTLSNGYKANSPSITLGAPVYQDQCYPDIPIAIPLNMLNRHGLIAGSTGTGKTKTLQLITEELSRNGIPVLLMDLKGDLSGLGAIGKPNPNITQRHQQLQIPYSPARFPLEFLTLGQSKGVPLRATVSEFGPLLLSQILELNETQTSILALLFQYCDDEKLPLVDLKDLKKVLNYLKDLKSKEFDDTYGQFAKPSASAIIRKITALEQQGGNDFFGEPSFEVDDLLRVDANGQGMISLIGLQDLQSKPKLFSSFMMSLLAEIYETFEEVGDMEKPKLVFFIDEAHLLFEHASKALLSHLEAIVRLIRSKGVGIFFCTQSPEDIPNAILGQCGLKIQHALRAFTAKDRKAIRLMAQNFPESSFYDTQALLTSLGVGEALITGLNEKGVPTPLAHTLLRAPSSSMSPLPLNEINQIITQSKIIPKYATQFDRESAYEMLQEKMQLPKATQTQSTKEKTKKSTKQSADNDLNRLGNTVIRQVGRSLAKELTRGLFGILGLRKRR